MSLEYSHSHAHPSQRGPAITASSLSHLLLHSESSELIRQAASSSPGSGTPAPSSSSFCTCFYSSISAYDSSGLNTDDIDRQVPFPVGRSPSNGHAERFAGVFADTNNLLVTSGCRLEGLKAQTQRTWHMHSRGISTGTQLSRHQQGGGPAWCVPENTP